MISRVDESIGGAVKLRRVFTEDESPFSGEFHPKMSMFVLFFFVIKRLHVFGTPACSNSAAQKTKKVHFLGDTAVKIFRFWTDLFLTFQPSQRNK